MLDLVTTIFLVAAAAAVCLAGGVIVVCVLQVMATRQSPPTSQPEQPGEPARAAAEYKEAAARASGSGEHGGMLAMPSHEASRQQGPGVLLGLAVALPVSFVTWLWWGSSVGHLRISGVTVSIISASPLAAIIVIW
jgi:hypothetical protein